MRLPTACIAAWLIIFEFGAARVSSVAGADVIDQTGTRPDQSAGIEFFERHVRPLLHQHCAKCHSREPGDEYGNLSLVTVRGLRAGGDRGPLLVPGDPEASLLLTAVRHEDDGLRMPPESKLSESEIEILARWIRSGAAMPESAPTKDPSAEKLDLAEGRSFWSFVPARRVSLPDDSGDKPGSRITALIDRELKAAGLLANPQADRRTLIRRATFAVTGLPPTPEEVQTFATDDAPDAYERLIDRLLASPHYGERAGRAWLDQARYTDTTPGWLKATDQAWLYRDWVVQAFNNDMPYDRFVTLQLAADHVELDDPRDLAALGLLGLSPTYWKELRLAPDLIRQVVADEWDERIDAVTQTFLGLTVSCARCHDHKFDPVTMHDYYALAGVFASTNLSDSPLLPPDAAQAVRQARTQVADLEAKLKAVEQQIVTLKKQAEQQPQPPEADIAAVQKMLAEQTQTAESLKEQIASIKSGTPHFDAPWAHTVEDAATYVVPDGADATRLDIRPGQFRNSPMFARGNAGQPGEEEPRGFIAVLSRAAPEAASASEQLDRRLFHNGSGRRELADAIMTDARDLACRVLVNRVWKQLFGRGLVTTPSNFGLQGSRPSHPELLDDLTARFIEHGLSIKWLHREILLSAVWQRSSVWSDQAEAVDPDNVLLWRANRRRLDIEAWRDAMLSAAGTLDASIGGPSIDLHAANNHRRTLYSRIDRQDLDPLLRVYDFPEPNSHSPGRDITTTPLQQLFVLNGPLLSAQARALSDRVLNEAGPEPAPRIQRLYGLLFQREPDDDEVATGLNFLARTAGPEDSATAVAASQASAADWSRYAHALLGLNEFLFID